MNEVASGRELVTLALRRLMEAIRQTRQRVLASEAPRAAGTPIDEEAVHDFRVALRRSRTVLRVAQNIWNTKQTTRLERELRYYARTTGLLRDDEVLQGTLGSMKPTDALAEETRVWLDKRSRKSRSTRRAVLRIVREGPKLGEAVSTRGKPVRPLAVVLDKLDQLLATEPSTNLSAIELAAVSIGNALDEVRRAASASVHDAPAMHTLRIREKRLRYTVELFPKELGEEGERLLNHATRMQKRLGDLHDLDDAIGTVTRARGISRPTRYATLTALHAARAACAAKVEPQLNEARQLDLTIALSCNESLPDSTT